MQPLLVTAQAFVDFAFSVDAVPLLRSYFILFFLHVRFGLLLDYYRLQLHEYFVVNAKQTTNNISIGISCFLVVVGHPSISGDVMYGCP